MFPFLFAQRGRSVNRLFVVFPWYLSLYWRVLHFAVLEGVRGPGRSHDGRTGGPKVPAPSPCLPRACLKVLLDAIDACASHSNSCVHMSVLHFAVLTSDCIGGEVGAEKSRSSS